MFIKLSDLEELDMINIEMFGNSQEVRENKNNIKFFLDIFTGKLYTGFELPEDYPDRSYFNIYQYAYNSAPKEKVLKVYPYVKLDTLTYDEKSKEYILTGRDEDKEARYTNMFTIKYLHEQEEKLLKDLSKELRQELEQNALERFKKFWVNKYYMHKMDYLRRLRKFCVDSFKCKCTNKPEDIKRYNESKEKLKIAHDEQVKFIKLAREALHDKTNYIKYNYFINKQRNLNNKSQQSKPNQNSINTIQQDNVVNLNQNIYYNDSMQSSLIKNQNSLHSAYEEYLRRSEKFDGTYESYLNANKTSLFAYSTNVDFNTNLQSTLQNNNNFTNKGGYDGSNPSNSSMNNTIHVNNSLGNLISKDIPAQTFTSNLRNVFHEGDKKVKYMNFDTSNLIETQEEKEKRLIGINKDMNIHTSSKVDSTGWHPNKSFQMHNQNPNLFYTNHRIDFPSYASNQGFGYQQSNNYQNPNIGYYRNPYTNFYQFPQVFGDAYNMMQQQNDMDLYRATQINNQVKMQNPTLLEENNIDFSNPESTSYSQNPYSAYQYASNMMNPNISYSSNNYNGGTPYSYGGYINNSQNNFVPSSSNFNNFKNAYSYSGNNPYNSYNYQYRNPFYSNPYGYGYNNGIPSYGYALSNKVMPPTEEDYALGLAFRPREVKVTKKHTNYFDNYKIKCNSKIIEVTVDEDGNEILEENNKKENINIDGYGNTGLVDVEYIDDWTKIPLNKYSKQPSGHYLKNEDKVLEDYISPLIDEIDKYNKMISYVVADSLYGDELTRDEFDIYIEYLANLLQMYKQKERINPNKDYRASYRYRKTPRQVDPSKGMIGYSSLELDLDWAPEFTVDENGNRHYSYDRGEEPGHEIENIFYNAEMQRRNMVIKKKKFENLLEYNSDQLKRMGFNKYDFRSRMEFNSYKYNKELRNEYEFYKEALRSYMSPKQFNIWWYGKEISPSTPPDRKTIRKRQIREMTENNLRMLNNAVVIDHNSIVNNNIKLLRNRIKQMDEGLMDNVKDLREFFDKLHYLEVLTYWQIEEQKQRDEYRRNNYSQRFSYYKNLHRFNNEGPLGYPGNPMPNSYSEPLDPKYGLPSNYRNYLCGREYEEKKQRFLNYCRTSKGKNMELKPVYK